MNLSTTDPDGFPMLKVINSFPHKEYEQICFFRNFASFSYDKQNFRDQPRLSSGVTKLPEMMSNWCCHITCNYLGTEDHYRYKEQMQCISLSKIHVVFQKDTQTEETQLYTLYLLLCVETSSWASPLFRKCHV